MVVRPEYTRGVLDETSVKPDPILQFSAWFEEALKAEGPEPTAMVLATASAEGRPSVRTILLKGHDSTGFFFATNYRSRKAVELEKNPNAALIFYWGNLQRQVRVEGMAKRVSAQESDQYFKSRPRGAQIGAWASAQSEVLASRAELEAAVKSYSAKFEGKEVPRPTHWGGFRLVPETIEFWQGRESRLHDRILYTRDQAGRWEIQRLAP